MPGKALKHVLPTYPSSLTTCVFPFVLTLYLPRFRTFVSVLLLRLLVFSGVSQNPNRMLTSVLSKKWSCIICVRGTKADPIRCLRPRCSPHRRGKRLSVGIMQPCSQAHMFNEWSPTTQSASQLPQMQVSGYSCITRFESTSSNHERCVALQVRQASKPDQPFRQLDRVCQDDTGFSYDGDMSVRTFQSPAHRFKAGPSSGVASIGSSASHPSVKTA